MVNIIVCDDEAVFLDIISDEANRVMSKHNLEYQCIKFKSSSDFVELIDKGETVPHIVFLDIDMPEIDGKQVALKLKKAYPNCQLIFFTSHEDEIVNAFDYNANGFLSKYNLAEKFEDNIIRVLGNINASEPDYVQLCVFTSDNRCERVNYDYSRIAYLECIIKKAYLNTVDGGCYRIKCGLWREIIQKFDKLPFAVPHQNYIVNMNCISRITGEELYIDQLNKQISVSKHRRKDFLKRYSDYSMSKGRTD